VESAFRDLNHLVAEAERQLLGICHMGVGTIVEKGKHHIVLINQDQLPLAFEPHQVQRVSRWLVLSVFNVEGVTRLHPSELAEREVSELEGSGGIQLAQLLAKAWFVDEVTADNIAEGTSAENQTDHIIDLGTREFRVNQPIGNLIDFARFTLPVHLAIITTPTYYDDWDCAWADFDSSDPTTNLENTMICGRLSFDLLLDFQRMKLRGMRLKDITREAIPLFLDPIDSPPDG
jgi:hypothetical protein